MSQASAAAALLAAKLGMGRTPSVAAQEQQGTSFSSSAVGGGAATTGTSSAAAGAINLIPPLNLAQQQRPQQLSQQQPQPVEIQVRWFCSDVFLGGFVSELKTARSSNLIFLYCYYFCCHLHDHECLLCFIITSSQQSIVNVFVFFCVL